MRLPLPGAASDQDLRLDAGERECEVRSVVEREGEIAGGDSRGLVAAPNPASRGDDPAAAPPLSRGGRGEGE